MNANLPSNNITMMSCLKLLIIILVVSSYGCSSSENDQTPRFVTKNKNQTIIDRWSSEYMEWQSGGAQAVDFDSAVHYCANLKLGGHNDWRVPSVADSNLGISSGYVYLDTVSLNYTKPISEINNVSESSYEKLNITDETYWGSDKVDEFQKTNPWWGNANQDDYRYIHQLNRKSKKTMGIFYAKKSSKHNVKCVRGPVNL